MDLERRINARVPYTGSAYLTFDGRCRCEEVVDLSAEGLFVKSSARLKVGQPVKVFLPLPVPAGGYRLCLLKGEVARRVGKRGASGVGITLRPDEIDTRAMLKTYVTGSA